jgi:hypothetical protein
MGKVNMLFLGAMLALISTLAGTWLDGTRIHKVTIARVAWSFVILIAAVLGTKMTVDEKDEAVRDLALQRANAQKTIDYLQSSIRYLKEDSAKTAGLLRGSESMLNIAHENDSLLRTNAATSTEFANRVNAYNDSLKRQIGERNAEMMAAQARFHLFQLGQVSNPLAVVCISMKEHCPFEMDFFPCSAASLSDSGPMIQFSLVADFGPYWRTTAKDVPCRGDRIYDDRIFVRSQSFWGPEPNTGVRPYFGSSCTIDGQAEINTFLLSHGGRALAAAELSEFLSKDAAVAMVGLKLRDGVTQPMADSVLSMWSEGIDQVRLMVRVDSANSEWLVSKLVPGRSGLNEDRRTVWQWWRTRGVPVVERHTFEDHGASEMGGYDNFVPMERANIHFPSEQQNQK